MLKFNFDYLQKIEPNLVKYLNIAQNSMATDPHNTMAKVRACMEFISQDMIKQLNKELNSNYDTSDTLNENINILEKNKKIDLKGKSACDVVRHSCNEVVHTLEADTEWAQLCLRHMDIFCRWYSKKYYNISTNNEVVIETYNGPKQEYTSIISHNDAKQAYRNLQIAINNIDDVLLIVASANLLNAYVKQKDAVVHGKNKYIFKNILVKRLEEVIMKNIPGVEVYYTKEITYVRLYELQFSFHYLAQTEFMKAYMNSSLNKVQQWSGIRLQPCSVIIFRRAMEYMNYEGRVC